MGSSPGPEARLQGQQGSRWPVCPWLLPNPQYGWEEGKCWLFLKGSQELNAISSPKCPIVGTAASTETDILGKNVLAPDLLRSPAMV